MIEKALIMHFISNFYPKLINALSLDLHDTFIYAVLLFHIGIGADL